MIAYTTTGKARIQQGDIESILRANRFMVGATLATFERQARVASRSRDGVAAEAQRRDAATAHTGRLAAAAADRGSADPRWRTPGRRLSGNDARGQRIRRNPYSDGAGVSRFTSSSGYGVRRARVGSHPNPRYFRLKARRPHYEQVRLAAGLAPNPRHVLVRSVAKWPCANAPKPRTRSRPEPSHRFGSIRIRLTPSPINRTSHVAVRAPRVKSQAKLRSWSRTRKSPAATNATKSTSPSPTSAPGIDAAAGVQLFPCHLKGKIRRRGHDPSPRPDHRSAHVQPDAGVATPVSRRRARGSGYR
jgi:hypothetical protein